MKRSLLLIIIGLGFTTIGFGQKKTPEIGKWYEFKEIHVKNYCWKSDDPSVTDTVVPAEWRHESAVFLYFENYYEAVRIKGKGLAISFIAHYRLKLLDKSALEDLSEIYYSQSPLGELKINYSAGNLRKKSFLGIKIIKPDGEEVVLDSEDFINDENGGKKIAVPNLEVGDIIDYYLFTWDYSYNKDVFLIIDKFLIGVKYPVKHFKYQLLTDKQWEVLLTTGENGLEIKEKKVGKRYYRFSIEGSDIPSTTNVMWNMRYYSSPFVKLYLKYSKVGLDERSNSKTYRTTKITTNEIKTAFGPYYEKNGQASNEYSAFLKYLEKTGKTSLTREQKLEEYFYYMRHHFINMHYIFDIYNQDHSVHSGFFSYEDDYSRYVSSRVFTGHMIYALDKMNIRYDVVVFPYRSDGPISGVLIDDELSYLVKARLKNPVYFYKPSVFTTFNQLPAKIEGVDAFSLYSPDKKLKNIGVKKISLPISDANSNSTSHEIEVKFNDEDPQKLDINTHITYKGLAMLPEKELYTDVFSMIWDENENYGTKEWGKEENSNEKIQIQMNEFQALKEKERKERFEGLAKHLFDTDDIELLNYENINTGNRVGETDFQISFDCIADNLVKKVGNNYIIKAGKIIGGQITIDDENQERDVDIYMKYARRFDYAVNISIPDGYEVKGLENFNLNIDNATGSVISSAEEKEGVVTIHFTKVYKHNYEKAEDWGLMKEFLIPASLFPSKEILLKKL